MSKVITFSRVFPSYHVKAGQPTYFVEKVITSLDLPENEKMSLLDLYSEEIEPTMSEFLTGSCNLFSHEPKHHTIRAGNRWKVGNRFSPRVWSGKPYNSPQITIAPDIEIKKVWTISKWNNQFFIEHEVPLAGVIERLCLNDGLSLSDFDSWFSKAGKKCRWEGQIICWNESINY